MNCQVHPGSQKINRKKCSKSCWVPKSYCILCIETYNCKKCSKAIHAQCINDIFEEFDGNGEYSKHPIVNEFIVEVQTKIAEIEQIYYRYNADTYDTFFDKFDASDCFEPFIKKAKDICVPLSLCPKCALEKEGFSN